MASNGKSFLEGRKLARADLGRVLVLGLGVSGKATVEYLCKREPQRLDCLCIASESFSEDELKWISDLLPVEDVELQVVEGLDAQSRPVLDELPANACDRFDLCIASPGISELSDFYQQAKGISDEVISEIELAWRESPSTSKWVAITGTNGKTTTTALCTHILKSAGFDAESVGNIGDAAISQVAVLGKSEHAIFVAETSSYQLASTSSFAPDIAIVLGITPDHLLWHGSLDAYADAKWKVLANLGESGGVAILDATNDVVREKVRQLKAMGANERGFEYIPLGTKAGITGDMRKACGAENAAFVSADETLDVAFEGTDHLLCKESQMRILGPHNQVNALAAASAAIALGAIDADVSAALLTFEPLEHRIEPSGVVDGVSYYNDSKATNVDATLVALKSFAPKKPIVLFGGRDKMCSLDDLVASCEENVRAAICYGEAADRFYEALDKGISYSSERPYELFKRKGMKEAFDQAVGMAEDGDIVLLSPACASFDEFSCFEERGETFKRYVREIPSEGRS